MKKTGLTIAIALVSVFAACTGAHNKTGGATRDSSASYGNSGPADTTKAASGAGAAARSDTSHTGNSTAEPTADSEKRK